MNPTPGCPPPPSSVISEKDAAFLRLRVIPNADSGMEDDSEWYDTRTGQPWSSETAVTLADSEPQKTDTVTFMPAWAEIIRDGQRADLTWDVDKGMAMLDDAPTESFILRELAARWFLWSRDLLPESVAENPRALSESDAMEALENHLAAMVEANLIDP